MDPSKLDSFYEKYPDLKNINNQISDYLTLFNDNVDSLVMDWNEDELQKYYEEFLKRQKVNDEYKEYNDEAHPQNEEVSFKTRVNEDDDEDFGMSSAPAKAPSRKPVAVAAVKEDVAALPKKTFDTSDLEESSVLSDMNFSDEDFDIDEDDMDNFGFEE